MGKKKKQQKIDKGGTTLKEHSLRKLIKILKPLSELMKRVIRFRKVDILLHNTEVKIRKCCE